MLNPRVEQMVAEASMALILDDLYELRDMAEIAMAASGFRYWHAGVVRIGVEWAAGTPDTKAAVFEVDSVGGTRFLYGDVDFAWPKIPDFVIQQALQIRYHGGVTA